MPPNTTRPATEVPNGVEYRGSEAARLTDPSPATRTSSPLRSSTKPTPSPATTTASARSRARSGVLPGASVSMGTDTSSAPRP